MRVLVIGSGGREHALVLALARDLAVDEVHAAPGNPGMAAVARLHAVDPLDGAQVGDLATSLGADLVVIGPEAPLVAGVADAVRAAGVPCFGAGAEASVILSNAVKRFPRFVTLHPPSARRPAPPDRRRSRRSG